MHEIKSASTTEDAADLGIRAAARMCALPFISAKLATVGVMWLAAWQHGSTGAGIPGWSQFRQVFAYWDAQHYLLIANQGYPTKVDPTPGGTGYLWINLPGYPELIRAANFVVHDDILCGVLLSAIFEFIALVFVARMVTAERDAKCARLAVWLVAFVPYGVFLTAVYAESPFLAASAACLYFMRKGRFVDASIAGAFATALRITGLALLPTVALEYWLQRRRNVRPDVIALPLIALPFGLFCWYAALRAGDASPTSTSQPVRRTTASSRLHG